MPGFVVGAAVGTVGGLTTGLLVFDVGGGVTLVLVVGGTLGAALGALPTAGIALGVAEGIVGGALADVVGAVSSTPPLDAGTALGFPVATTRAIASPANTVTTPIAPRIIGAFDRGAVAVEALPHDAPVAEGLSVGGGCCAPEDCAHVGPFLLIGDACMGIVGSIIGGLPGQLAPL